MRADEVLELLEEQAARFQDRLDATGDNALTHEFRSLRAAIGAAKRALQRTRSAEEAKLD